MQTQVLRVNASVPDLTLVRQAAAALRTGQLVAFPTDTVYGIGSNVADGQAVARLYLIKDRPRHKPLTVHIADVAELDQLVDGPRDAVVERLIQQFWPGPLTLVFRAVGGGTVGVRLPNHEVARRLIRESQVRVVAPSANVSGDPPSTTAVEVMKSLGGQIEVILDGGRTTLGVESTVMDVSVLPHVILREGAVSREELEPLDPQLLKPKIVLFVCTGNSCRSVMALGLLRKLVEGRAEIDVRSAGVGAMPGMRASWETLELLLQEGVDLAAHRARRLTDDQLTRADLILVMERRHRDIVLQQSPHARGKVFLLREFAGERPTGGPDDLDIPDPIGQSLEVYRTCFATIRRCLETIVAQL